MGSEVVPGWIFACPSDIFVSFGQPKCWRNPCVGVRSNAVLLSLGFLLALTDAVPSAIGLRDFAPQTSGGPLYESLLFIRRLVVSSWHADRVPSCSQFDSTMPNRVSGAWSYARGMPLRLYEQRFPVCVTRRPARPGRCRSCRAGSRLRRATWLILPVVICLSQRLSHACVSMN